MNLLDLLLVLLAISAAVGGYRLGFVGRLMSWLGLVTGLLLGSAILPALMRRLHDASEDILRPCLGHQVEDHLRVSGGAKDRAVRFQLSTQPLGIDEIAIVGNGQGAASIVH